MDVSSLLGVVKTSILLSLRTGNVYLDMFVQCILIAALSSGVLYLGKFCRWLRSTGRTRGAVTTVSSIITVCNGDTGYASYVIRSNPTMKAVMFKMLNNTSIKIPGISEMPGAYRKQTSGPIFAAENSIAYLDVEIKVAPDVYCFFTTINVDGLQELPSDAKPPNAEKQVTTNKKEVFCKIYSYTLTTHQLIQLLHNEWVVEYEEEVARDRESRKNQYFVNLSPVGYAKEFSSTRTFDNLFFEGKDLVLTHLNWFMNNREWYQQTGIPYSLGFAMSGPPGTGKTSCIKAIANYTGRDIVCVSLKTIKSVNDLQAIFFDNTIGLNDHSCKPHERIIVMEDIDAMDDIVHSRAAARDVGAGTVETALLKILSKDEEKKEEYPGITLSDLLNVTDGIFEADGRIWILTTNFPEKLDSALMRPGRIDVHIQFKMCSTEIIGQIIAGFYRRELDCTVENVILELGLFSKQISPAQVSCICKAHMHNGWRRAVAAIRELE